MTLQETATKTTKYILDSDTIIYFLQGEESVANKVGIMDISKIYTTTINQAELYYGAYNSSHPRGNLTTLKSFFSAMQILEFESEAAKEYGELKAELKKKGQLIADMDICIAAIAKANKMVVVTNNTKDFSRIEGLTIENWRDEQ